jgi:hypothetical protein
MAEASGNLTAASGGEGVSQVTITLNNALSTDQWDTQCLIGVSGTYSGSNTVAIYGLLPGSTVEYPLNCVNQLALAAATGTLTPGANATVSWLCYCAGYAKIRIKCTAYTSGTMAVEMKSGKFLTGAPTNTPGR